MLQNIVSRMDKCNAFSQCAIIGKDNYFFFWNSKKYFHNPYCYQYVRHVRLKHEKPHLPIWNQSSTCDVRDSVIEVSRKTSWVGNLF